VNAIYTRDLGLGWSILTGFIIEEFPKTTDYVAIFNHSDNGCYQFIINDLQSKEKEKTFQFRKTGESGFNNSFYSK